jgi:uncharacterized protein YoaH (UPF0181 family)
MGRVAELARQLSLMIKGMSGGEARTVESVA